MEHKKTVAVDLDGVLAKYTGFKGSKIIEDPAPTAKKLLQELSKEYIVAVYTSRQTEVAVAWLERYNLLNYIDAVNYCQIERRAGKPVAVAYIDDRAVRWEGDLYQTLADVDELARISAERDAGKLE